MKEYRNWSICSCESSGLPLDFVGETEPLSPEPLYGHASTFIRSRLKWLQQLTSTHGNTERIMLFAEELSRLFTLPLLLCRTSNRRLPVNVSDLLNRTQSVSVLLSPLAKCTNYRLQNPRFNCETYLMWETRYKKTNVLEFSFVVCNDSEECHFSIRCNFQFSTVCTSIC